MNRSLAIILFTFLCYLDSSAQYSRYLIQLANKSGTPYSIKNPAQFLTQRSLDRRARYNIKIDSTDLPVNPAYIDSIRLSGNVSILNVSKWFNQVCIQTTDANALSKINSFSFVAAANPVAASIPVSPPVNKRPVNIAAPDTSKNIVQNNITGFFNYGQSYNQVHLNNGDFLHNHNFRGEGMIIAVTDDGFYHYETLPTFDSIRANKQILSTWDFVAVDSDVNEQDTHGMECFSTIAANMPDTFVGTAPYASFYLYRTEDVNSEYPIEMHNWIAAAERADSLGVDVMSVSLGYNIFSDPVFNYTYADMNGNSTVIAKGVNAAARKGLMVVVAAGNDGDDSWQFVETPGDADSALTAGAVDIYGQSAYFSSFGPNSAGQMKPDVVAVGLNAVVAYPLTGEPYFNNGTSFATPITAGLTTCLWQAFPEISNMNMIDILHKASSLANNPNYRIGYGIPDMKKAFVLLIKKLHGFQSGINNCKTTLNWTAKSDSTMSFVIERKLATDINYAPINTQKSDSAFVANNFTYTDDLSSLQQAMNVNYRIKMNIATDTSFYLDSVTVYYDGSCSSTQNNTEKISISPNPATQNLSVTVTRNETSNIGIAIYTETGQQVFNSTYSQAAGIQVYTIPIQGFSNGIYYVSVYVNNRQVAIEKILR